MKIDDVSLAFDPETPSATLNELCRSENVTVRHGVAQHRKTSPILYRECTKKRRKA